jgi:poly(3-hydroxyalkanoate) depolymerase
MSLTDNPTAGNRVETPGAIEARRITVGSQLLEVAIRHGDGSGLPLLLFNGIGANWELAKPFLEALTTTTAVIFDIPGVGGSPTPLLPYRPSTLARLAAGLMAELGHTEIDVAGVSWGGGIAQQFAYQYPKLCRRLVLAATAPGFTMVPASPSVLWKMATPRRYTDKGYMNRVAADIYGGAFRYDPALIGQHATAMRGAGRLGYFYQLLAVAGWTSLPWLWSLPQPTLVLMGSDDPLVPPINGHMLAGLIPNAELQMVEDGHLFLVTRPAETAALIEAFLAGEARQAQPSALSRAARRVMNLVGTTGGGRQQA